MITDHIEPDSRPDPLHTSMCLRSTIHTTVDMFQVGKRFSHVVIAFLYTALAVVANSTCTIMHVNHVTTL